MPALAADVYAIAFYQRVGSNVAETDTLLRHALVQWSGWRCCRWRRSARPSPRSRAASPPRSSPVASAPASATRWAPAGPAAVVAQPANCRRHDGLCPNCTDCPKGICATPNYHWRTWDKDPDRAYLYRGEVQVGGYDLKPHYYMPYDAKADRWGDAAKPPIQPPCCGVSGTRSPTNPSTP
jgi:hypothetical protein